MEATRVPDEAQAAILAWYGRHGRKLAFRATTDPYAVLVSEVMAQQTQVSRVKDGLVDVHGCIPDHRGAGDAAVAEVLRAWQGLGYNRRALNLWRAARAVVDEHGGELPLDVAARWSDCPSAPTRRAVAAIAFGMPVGAVDTGDATGLARVVAGSRHALPAVPLAVAGRVMPRFRAADWTHALMDVGATVCRGSKPACQRCPARRSAATRRPPDPWRWRGPRRIPGTGVPVDVAVAPWPDPRRLARWNWLGRWLPIGQHERPAIEAALADLAADGLIERAADGGLRARLPIATAAASG